MSRAALETPMMRQFLAIKAEHPDAIVFYRMGDFYEMFLDDAVTAAPLLDIALTTRDKGKDDAVPMCGVPVHAAEGHVQRLVGLGHRVAICEQVEDPKAAARRGGSKLVRREVVEVVTPGLTGDPTELEAAREVTLAALVLAPATDAGPDAGRAGLALLEASTGSFRVTAHDAAAGGVPAALLEELERVGPRELLLAETGAEALARALAERLPSLAVTPVPEASFDPGAVEARPDGFDPKDATAATRAAAGLLSYVTRHQPFALRRVARLRPYRLGDAMILDAPTRSHLELFESLEDRSRRGTLLERLDATVTPLGARRLARWIAYPLLDSEAIRERQEAVARLADDDRRRARLREALAPVRDLERLLARSGRPGAMPRDLGSLRSAAGALPGLAAALGASPDLAGAEDVPLLRAPAAVPQVVELLEQALIDDPPVIAKGSRGAQETGYIREGFRPELDALRDAGRKGREWVAGLELRERERSGIANLKVRFHPVHGYSLEVTKTNLARVPEDWERKQTLANAERFTTAELREQETHIRGATERAAALEREVFEAVRQAVLENAAALGAAAERVAELDALAALAEVARRDGWVRPEIDASTRIEVRGGRHPVVEPMLQRRGEEFVPNDIDLESEATQILLLTGPNMSGKSTYLRQTALLVLLAQIGSFVPAESARIGVVDRIFTRVGASDRLARGESTFMVEMRETAEILAQASPRSLVILDEIGRGTSTYDGLSIAWAVAEYLHDTPGLGARTLFATHYHELADLARTRPRVRNAHFEAREWSEEVIFLRRLVAGAANRSYGIQVARLAGLPDLVIQRAREILHNLESGEFDAQGRPRLAEGDEAAARVDQLPLFAGPAPPDAAAGGPDQPRPGEAEASAVAAELRACDPDRLTPLDALLLVKRLRERLAETEGGRMRARGLILAVLALALLGVDRPKGLGDVSDVRHWSYPDYTRVVVELSRAVGPGAPQVRRLAAAAGRRERLYLDLGGIWVGRRFEEPIPVGDGLLHAIRLGQNTLEHTRMVIDLDRYERHRLLVLSSPPRVVVDVFGARGPAGSTGPPRLAPELRPVRTVVIDAGHGGRDPGAIGVAGLREKDVTLRLARALAPQLEARGFRVVLTRDADRTLSLEERTAIAEGVGGDVFISLHANASRRAGAHGVETYYLDESHERHTLRLAALESGVAPRHLDELQRTLASLRVSAVSEQSAALARSVHRSLLAGLQVDWRRVTDLGVKTGPFYVLFLSSMPAILVETGFLTNRDEASRLRDPAYLARSAERIAEGIARYRARHDVRIAGGTR